jgi:hypothetical protein
VANFSTDSDLLEYEPEIKNYGIQDFSDLHAKSKQDILRHLRIHWWPRSSYYRYDITAITYTEMDDNLITESQFTRASVYHVLGYYIYPRLSTFSPEGDVFREKMQYYRQEYANEIDAILKDGVEYDYDSSGTITDSEKRPTHFNRLVR